ncbi:Crotonobetainyl-CoA:carnitine CoA-transferase CaiB [Streptoalloteichus tenebrarius]|uniref:Crotonobetainyl-CoA:carnitine CoA-transferase CaiB n=1 Tax=Streptoalloteichus tenebrarius (strain ATCC 17920 / DSM 40477 / JCM 4838 / CBS 697.72 / NBRC 16177 / NCIMB 11028 / NRRL B-12390 / A12253. 1 / ISP 5477) TaxID=1933 RepID=A0ABT1HX63_STRSD|nr:CaiB/BaiF CoA-transferase family protein [Streptoalloteichus tenebrarius]MCP2260116.1 Crotonobetainyl-CoA:carnitine CoA-transferase CaiB [Streptoalloteichus tenebrarius]BFF00561.1 CaiB/BaiF CoA-transferase family protein [Streptoalloteichus tenebrarius]
MKPLAGTVVVGLEHAVAVPYATRLLADLGARVIKVERRGSGDFARDYDRACGAVSSYFAWTNVGKESIALDVRHPDGRRVLDRLLARADVVLCNYSPAAARRLGVDAETLRAARPELVVGELSSYGEGGPYDTRKAFDALAQSETGLIELTGEGEVRARAGISVADIAAGVQLHAAVLAALLHRERTGEGVTLRLSLMEALAEWMHQPLLYAAGTGVVPPRSGAHHASIAPYGPFSCADGGAVHLAVQNEPQWRRLCAEVLGRAELADDPRFRTVSDRVANRSALHAELQLVFDRMDADELLAALDAADVPAARTRGVLDLLDHPQLTARDRWRRVPVPEADPVPMLTPPVSSGSWEWTAAAVPALGEHTDAILTWLGYSEAEIRQLRATSAG